MIQKIFIKVKYIINSERIRTLSREGIWILLGQGVAVAGSFVGVRVLTGLLTPASYGELALGMTLAMLVNQIILGPLSNGITRFYAPAIDRGDLNGFLDAVLRLVFSATGIIVLLSVILTAGLFIAGRTEWIAIGIAAFIFSILSGYNSILSGIQNAARQRSIVALHQGMESWTRILVAAGLIFWLGTTSTVAMTGYAVSVILVLGSQLFFFRKAIIHNMDRRNLSQNWQKDIWSYSWPFASWGIFTWAQLASDRWALGLFNNTNEVGYYVALYQLGYYPMSMATTMAIQFLAPVFYQKAGDASDPARNAEVSKLSLRLTGLALGFTGIAFMAAYLLHEEIFKIFVSAEYVHVSYLMPWMLLAGGLFAAGQVIALDLMSQMKPHIMLVAKIITSLLGIILNFIGAYFFGTSGIVFSGVIFSAVYLFWMTILSRKAKK